MSSTYLSIISQFQSVRYLYVVVVMFFLSVMNIFWLRDGLSLTITQMVKPKINPGSAIDDTCPVLDKSNEHNGTTMVDAVGTTQSFHLCCHEIHSFCCRLPMNDSIGRKSCRGSFSAPSISVIWYRICRALGCANESVRKLWLRLLKL